MFDLAVIALRWVQMTGAMILFGSSLFFLYALPNTGAGSAAGLRWPRPLLMLSAAAVLIACLLGFLAQTVVLAGSVQDALQPDALSAAATGMSFGKSSIVRAAAAGLFLITFAFFKPGRPACCLAAVAGGLICASFAWMGHGAATPGPAGMLHTANDIKLIVFLAMLGLAAANRFHLTPRLGRALPDAAPTLPAIAALRRSLVSETGLSLIVIALVAWFGTLAPPAVL